MGYLVLRSAFPKIQKKKSITVNWPAYNHAKGYSFLQFRYCDISTTRTSEALAWMRD